MFISLNTIKTDFKPLRIIEEGRMWVSFIFHSEISVSIWLERAFIHQLLMAAFPFGRKEKRDLSGHSVRCQGLY